MRIIALTVVVFGVAVLGSAQSRLQSPDGSRRAVAKSGSLTVEQTTPIVFQTRHLEISKVGETTLMRGDIRIQIGEAEIRADEAEMDSDTREIALRGNVRLMMPPPAASPSTR